MQNFQNLSRQKKIEILSLQEELDRRKSENPLKYFSFYQEPRHEKQILMHESHARIRVVYGGNRTGKSEGGAKEVAMVALGEHETIKAKKGDVIWCFCPSFDVQKTTTQLKLSKYIPEKRIVDKNYVHSKIWKDITLDNGVTIVFKSYEQGAEKAQGAGLILLWFDEEPPYDIWREATMRHEAGRRLNILLTMTPVNGMTWSYDKIFMATDNQDIEIFIFTWDDNPYLTEEQKKEMAKGLTDEELAVRRDGKYITRVGLVCPWWNRDLVINTLLEEDLSYYEVIDFGWSDPTAYLLVSMNKKGEIEVIDGFRERELEAEEIVRRRNEIVGGRAIRRGISDNDNPRLNQELVKLGMNVIPIQKIVPDSGSWDEYLARRLAFYGKNGRLMINRELAWLIQEIETLFWLQVKRKDGEEVKPMWDDHRRFGHHYDGMRALAYLLASSVIEPLPEIIDKWKDKEPGTYHVPLRIRKLRENNENQWSEEEGVSFDE